MFKTVLVPVYIAKFDACVTSSQLMQDSAQQQKQQLQMAVTDTEQQIDALRKWVGEAGDADPTAMLNTIWTFANLFDQAYHNVQRLLI